MTSGSPTTIGPYTITRELGRGGMGDTSDAELEQIYGPYIGNSGTYDVDYDAMIITHNIEARKCRTGSAGRRRGCVAKLARDQFGVVQSGRISIGMAQGVAKVGGREAKDTLNSGARLPIWSVSDMEVFCARSCRQHEI